MTRFAKARKDVAEKGIGTLVQSGCICNQSNSMRVKSIVP